MVRVAKREQFSRVRSKVRRPPRSAVLLASSGIPPAIKMHRKQRQKPTHRPPHSKNLTIPDPIFALNPTRVPRGILSTVLRGVSL
jgi:hypothetical protein